VSKPTGKTVAQDQVLKNSSDKKGSNNGRSVKTALVGTGKRGMKLLDYLLLIDGVEITAVCDEIAGSAEKAASVCINAGRKAPAVYSGTKDSYRSLIDREKPDALIIATYWDAHAPVALYAMNNGVYPGIDVPAALTVDDLWNLVETSEKTGIPCMMLENWSFRRDNLAVLNMKRLGLFGEIVHCHCAHSHNCIDHWFFDKETGKDNWQADYLMKYNRDQYPTHALGPVIGWMDINRGDVFNEIYTVSSYPRGINTYFSHKFGKNHPNATRKFRQGDIVTSLITTRMGKTLVINNDMMLPRPYSNRWMLQGTRGVYYEEKNSVYLAGHSPEYQQWEPWKPYEDKYNHKWWQEDMSQVKLRGADYVMLTRFVNSARTRGPAPLDVYDSAVMSAVVELSGISIKKKRPVRFPDFTRGGWEKNKPYFAV